MSLQLRNHGAEYRDAVSKGVAGSILFHLLVIAFGGSALFIIRTDPEQQILGYRGPTRVVREIDIIEPNSIQSYFHQRRREGRRRSPEYRVVERFETEAGPEPIPVRQPEKQPDPDPRTPVEDVELMEPVVPVHREISFSQDFVILQAIEPDYPEYERSQMVEGYVLIACYVTPQGDIDAEQVLESGTRPTGGSARAFELAALEAVKKWRILPPLRDGEPQGAWVKIPINFEITSVSP